MLDLYALFVTTATSEPDVNVRAWRATMGPATRVIFDINGPQRDSEILQVAEDGQPDIIFYTGGESGPGLPSVETLQALRKITKTVQIQGDMGDPPWHPMLKLYRERECFDLQVGMDGVSEAPIDYVTLTPIDPEPFNRPPRKRNFQCGFAGNHIGRERFRHLKGLGLATDPRSEILHALGDLLQLRERELDGSYASYIAFYRRCRMMLNTSWAGSGLVHHVKGRVLESAFAGCALLEMAESQTGHWFPADSFFTYRSVAEAADIIRSVSNEEIAERAVKFEAHARANYTPAQIFLGIVQKVGLA